MWYAMLAIEYEQTASADNTALKKKKQRLPLIFHVHGKYIFF